MPAIGSILKHRMKAFALTTFALIAFAFNSILCRMALAGGHIDAASFTAVRLVSGAVVLAAILLLHGKTRSEPRTGSWASAFFLFAYAVTFSFAYLGLTAATGALILFGSVQMTMIGGAIFRGERPRRLEWMGLVVALAGLIYLVFPGLSAPPLINAVLMAAAGVAWGFYTLRGKGSEKPLADTAGNFIRSVPMIAIVVIPLLILGNLTVPDTDRSGGQLYVSTSGAVLAMLSGAVASGLGYTVWYAALRFHSAARAAVLQLSVPLIAAAGGVLLLSEPADLRLAVSAALILGGIGLTILGKGTAKTLSSAME